MSTKQGNNMKKGHGAGLLFIVLLTLILLPFLYLGWTFVTSYMESKSPVLGNRFKGDLDPAITKEQLNNVDAAVAKIEGVQAHEVHLETATVRVYVDLNDDASADVIKQKAEEAYQAALSVLPVDPYFKQAGEKKMYDLEIHAFNVSGQAENFAYVIETKNSGMEAPVQQLVSQPVNAEVAQSLRDAVEARKQAKAAEQQKQQSGKQGTSEIEGASAGEVEEKPAQ